LVTRIEKRFPSLPDELNVAVITENDEFEVAVVKGEEMWSFVGNKANDQWL